MLKTIWSTLKDLAGSKKFQAAVLSGLIWGLGHFGLHATPEQLAPIVGPIWLYVFGQALADIGKSAAQVSAVADTKPANDNTPAAKDAHIEAIKAA